MIKVLINNQIKSAYKWHEKNGVYVIGYGYIDNQFYQGQELLEHFIKVKNQEDFLFKLHQINGIVSVIIIKDDLVFAATDKAGAFEIFYSKIGEDIYISNQVQSIMDESGQTLINEEGKKDFIYAGFIFYGQTLLSNIYSVNARKYMVYKGQVTINYYYEIEYGKKDFIDYHDIKKQFDEVVHKVAKRLVMALNDREVLVPLSGGIDSRFILLLLKKMNYQKVTCFSYGSSVWGERKIARKIAADCGYEFLDIPYKRSEWKALFKDKAHESYFMTDSNYQNMVHTMDYFAARHIDIKNCVILPGHYGAVAKTYFNEPLSKEEAIDLYIYDFIYYYSKNHTFIKDYLQKRLEPYFEDFNQLSDIYSQQKRFDAVVQDGYRSKHVMKAVKSYEHYELRWMAPLLDDDIIDFMSKVPPEYKGPEKKFLGSYTNERFNHYPYYKLPNIGIYKVIRNIFDRRYACVSLHDYKSWELTNVPMPKKVSLIYSFYRNFLSYIAIKNEQLLERVINGK